MWIWLQPMKLLLISGVVFNIVTIAKKLGVCVKGGKREDGLYDDKVGCIDQTVGRAKGESESEVAKRLYHTCAHTLKPGRCDSCRPT